VTDDRSAALLVRVWLEDGTDEFRARLTAVGGAGPDEDVTVAVTSSPSDVLVAVGDWLHRFTRPGTDPD
jgi:hypothetical protein